jgi:hypothetical protein
MQTQPKTHLVNLRKYVSMSQSTALLLREQEV